MNLYGRFKRLSLWNKLGALGAIASLAGLLALAMGKPPQTAGPPNVFAVEDQSPAISAGRDVHVTYGDRAPVEKNLGAPPVLTADFLRLMMPNMRGGGASPRYLDGILGLPILESESSRTYIVEGHRIDRSWGSSEYFTIGPAVDSKIDELQELSLVGPWGQISGKFGQLTIADFVDASSYCKISEWTHGTHGRCFNLFEIECGGSQLQDGLYYRAGVDSCSFALTHLNEKARELLYRPILDAVDASSRRVLNWPSVRSATINFLMVTDQERQCPRGAGCS